MEEEKIWINNMFPGNCRPVATTDRHMLHYVNGSLSAIEDMSMDRMRAAVVKLRAEIKKHIGVE